MTRKPDSAVVPDDLVWNVKISTRPPVYRIDERPARLWEALLYGWQHTLVDISPFVLPLVVAAALGMSCSQEADFINYCLFAMGIATLIQTTIGNRLPIIQGPSATLTGTLAPVASQLGPAAMWGGAFIGAVAEMLIGASGILKSLRRLFPPVVSGVVILSIALALGQVAVRLFIGDGKPENFVFGLAVMALIFLLQIRFAHVAGGLFGRAAVLIAIFTVGVLGAGVFGRVDWELIAQKPWIALPGLMPFGGPGFGWTFSLAAGLTIFAGYLGSIVESLGDYAATCTVAGEAYRVRHMSRGIFAEGVGCMIATLFGGLPCTSYTQNIGIIAATGVASRFVVRIAAIILLLFGLCPKFGALLVAMPRSVLGGVFIVVCGMIAVSGIRLLAAAPATSANALLVGASIILAAGVPVYVRYGLGMEWLEQQPIFLRLALTNSVVLAVICAIGLHLLLNLIWKGEQHSGH